jgi:radical SAM protein with 4Fe4S-binding SPASM domain
MTVRSEAPALRVVAWEATRRCPLRCRHCRGGARDETPAGELTTAEGLRLVEAVAAAGRPLLILTGGEPMVRPDFYDLLERARELGLRTAVAPCGGLLDEPAARRLREVGVARISISLDGPSAETHDRFRGVPGAFDTAVRALEHARAASLPFQVNTTVTRGNAGKLPAILDLAVRLGAAAWDLFFLVPVGRGAALAAEALDAVGMAQTLDWVADARARQPVPIQVTCAPQFAARLAERGKSASIGARGCLAGRGFLFVSHRGRLQPCGFLELPCGDLRQDAFDLARLWQTSAWFQKLRDPALLAGACGACAYRELCGGCRARALATTGDPRGPEPACPMAREEGYNGDGQDA